MYCHRSYISQLYLHEVQTKQICQFFERKKIVIRKIYSLLIIVLSLLIGISLTWVSSCQNSFQGFKYNYKAYLTNQQILASKNNQSKLCIQTMPEMEGHISIIHFAWKLSTNIWHNIVNCPSLISCSYLKTKTVPPKLKFELISYLINFK